MEYQWMWQLFYVHFIELWQLYFRIIDRSSISYCDDNIWHCVFYRQKKFENYLNGRYDVLRFYVLFHLFISMHSNKLKIEMRWIQYKKNVFVHTFGYLWSRWSKTTLISSSVCGAWVNPPSWKMVIFFS